MSVSTPLHVAVLGNNRSRISQLLQQSDCNVCALDNEGMSALHYAAAYDESAIVTELLQHESSNANVTNRRINTPLHTAAAHDASAAIESLLNDARTDLNAVNLWQETPLIVACSGGHVRAVRVLLAHGADRSRVDRWQSTALDVAEANQATEVVELLRHFETHGELPPLPLSAPLTTTVLRLRSFCLAKLIEAPLDNERFLQLLHNPEIDVNAPDYYGMTVLHKLVAWNKAELVAPFLAHRRADVALLCRAAAGKSRDTALHLAVQMGAVDAARELLRCAPRELVDELLAMRDAAHQQSAAELAAHSGQSEFVAMFNR